VKPPLIAWVIAAEVFLIVTAVATWWAMGAFAEFVCPFDLVCFRVEKPGESIAFGIVAGLTTALSTLGGWALLGRRRPRTA
jgi:hypothetical protein